MPSYDEILDTEVDAESPVTESLMTRLRDNPEAVAGGDASVPSAKRVLADAMRTDSSDTDARLAPDGSGGVKWAGGRGFGGAEIDGTGLGAPVANIEDGGIFHFDALAISGSAQTPDAPVVVYCTGDISISQTITSPFPIVLRADGNIDITAAITAPWVDIRAGGTLSITANINCHSTSSYSPTLLDIANAVAGRIVRLFSTENMTISGATITADDVWIRCGGSLTLSTTTIRGLWLASRVSSGSSAVGWTDLGISNVAIPGSLGTGGGGGTGGSAGSGSGTGGPASRWLGASRAYLQPCSALARGGGGAPPTAGTSVAGAGGGRVSVHAVGTITATGSTINVSGEVGSGTNYSSGAGGVLRVSSLTEIVGGTYSSTGAANATGGGGGNGGNFLLAPAFSGSITQNYGSADSAQATITAAEMAILDAQGIFDIPKPEFNY